MKLNLPALLMIFAGALLIYGAHSNQDPRNVIFAALGLKQRVANPATGNVGTNLGPGTFAPHVAGSATAVPGQKVTTV